MSKIPARLVFLAVYVSWLFVSRAQASDDTTDRQTLSGLHGVSIMVDDLPPGVPPGTLAKSAIQADVESKLREAGIPVARASAGTPVLHVSLELLVSADSVCPYNMTVQVEQRVTLIRNPATSTIASTWEVGSFGTVSKTNLGDLRDSIKDKIDRFINAYRAVNPQ